ncbi:Lpp/OprI family alanine-zipper lipoprotein [Crenothrix polyspora]|jgi:murein lipoprotein|uniref:Lipoprotein n=1 Tax=Crenothrix polyspora TaxID=360316 RepID=A0A1R4HHW0_9GAMM|nr:Lpp/OprI family alanine-zipper lipoprotein [Crenothrix polyspora]SJM95470.1 conserved exported hypothetical protein [Crenothrix polyspora]
MKKLIKLSLIGMATSLVVGCATNSDIENLQSQIDGLKTSVTQASADASSAQAAASEAKDAANRAATASEEANRKLDRMFQKTMQK